MARVGDSWTAPHCNRKARAATAVYRVLWTCDDEQEKIMKPVYVLPVLAAAVAGIVYGILSAVQRETPVSTTPAAGPAGQAPEAVIRVEAVPGKTVLDISVHTLDELRVVLDRAERLASRLLDETAAARIVLVLHGPEVEFFSRRNYAKYRDVVDQAARLDAMDIVDVKICRTMMNIKGVARDDIPAFIEQVPDGRVEVQRLLDSGYAYF